MTRLLTAAIALMAFVGSALADGLPYRSKIAGEDVWSWTGLYLGGGVGGQFAHHEVDVTHDAAPATLFNVNGLSGIGLTGNVRAGFDWQIGQSLIVGPFVGYSFGESEFSASSPIAGAALTAHLTPTWDAGLRLGLIGPNRSLVYAGYRYQMAELSVSGPAGLCAVVGVQCNHDLGGHGLIAGLEIPITKVVTFGVEYGFTRFDSAEIAALGGGPDKLRVNADTDVHSVTARLNFRLGPNLFGN